MKYFKIFDENFATIFQLRRNIGNISEMFLQYSVLCGWEGTRLDTFQLDSDRLDTNYWAQ